MNTRLLLIDDEAAVRDLYSLYLGIRGFKVSTAARPVEALNLVGANHYDAVLLDLGLGDFNGMDLIEPLRVIEPDLPIFIFTGRICEDGLRQKALLKGAVGFLVKSHPLDYVANEIQRQLRALTAA